MSVYASDYGGNDFTAKVGRSIGRVDIIDICYVCIHIYAMLFWIDEEEAEEEEVYEEGNEDEDEDDDEAAVIV
mgnify:CR=1 FL=1